MSDKTLQRARREFDRVIKSPDKELKELVSMGLDTASVIPVFSIISKASDFIGNWANRRFVKRLYKFINGCSDISEEDRLIFFSDLEECEEKRESAAEIMMEIISKTDSVYKVEILVNLMKACVKGSIETSMFFRLSYSIQNLTSQDLKDLTRHVKPQYIAGLSDVLLSAGLLAEGQSYDINPPDYALNANGRALLDYGLPK